MASGFAAANACAPISPRERSESTRCTETASERPISSSRELQRVTPISSQRACVRFCDQAQISMPKARPSPAILRARYCPDRQCRSVDPARSRPEPALGKLPAMRLAASGISRRDRASNHGDGEFGCGGLARGRTADGDAARRPPLRDRWKDCAVPSSRSAADWAGAR